MAKKMETTVGITKKIHGHGFLIWTVLGTIPNLQQGPLCPYLLVSWHA